MSANAAGATITISVAELEDLIQRVVREAVREELTQLLRTPSRSILEYWVHEGPDDPEGDGQLLAEALDMIEKYDKDSTGWKSLEQLEAELAETESTRGLPG